MIEENNIKMLSIPSPMELERKISEVIIDEYFTVLKESLNADAVVVGGGPSGLYSAYKLANDGYNTVLIDRRLSLGGGIWGGGMMFNMITFTEESREIFDEIGIKYHEKNGLYVANAVELAGALIYNLARSGAKILNGVFAEDVVLKDHVVKGVVINWSTVQIANLMVDPLVISSKVVIDATGHPAEVVHHLSRRNNNISIQGEGAMDAARGDVATVMHTNEIYHGLIVCGMASNAVCGAPRMGPTFGGMLLSGRKAYELAKERIENSD